MSGREKGIGGMDDGMVGIYKAGSFLGTGSIKDEDPRDSVCQAIASELNAEVVGLCSIRSQPAL